MISSILIFLELLHSGLYSVPCFNYLSFQSSLFMFLLFYPHLNVTDCVLFCSVRFGSDRSWSSVLLSAQNSDCCPNRRFYSHLNIMLSNQHNNVSVLIQTDGYTVQVPTPVPVPVPVRVLPPERFPHAALLSRALPAARCGPRCLPAGTLLQVRVAVQQSAGGPAVMLRSQRVVPLSHHWKRQTTEH